MMDGCVRAVIEAIHSSPTQVVVYLSGGASHVLGWLTSVPGASNTLLEAVVPYSRMSSIQLLGKIPTHFTSQQTAEEMALLAYNRALKLSRPGAPVLGVGFTGSLATTRPKLGDHRFHVSTRTSDRLWLSSVTLSKGFRTREEEEIISSQFLLEAIASGCKVQAGFSPELSETDVLVETERQFNEDEELSQLLNGEICSKVYNFSSEAYPPNSERKTILPGSFNPLHDGHLKLLDVASSICDGHPCFEISAVNADKPPLTISQIKERVTQFEKIDTAVRLINPKYYDGNYEKMIEILLRCKNTGCTFLVGGRNVDGIFKVLEDIDIPDVLKDMFISIPAEKFRMDISSTEIRKSHGI
ncbi:hypothetical protein Nepgr_003758 [Nepenthes gracilis]|uniref:Cytidyltransferase-like domain-containing protein n=1 Tax=Nepenthes gracilis TaxID=150966 RepID=A0AAD3XE38_NEPGR|nr:hypothetical protein Nepgr_003758 [Nepenthes gracilis]